MGCCKVIGYLVVLVAVLVGLLLSGTLARWGAIRKLDEVMLANGMPAFVGLTPSSYVGLELPFTYADVPDQTGKVALVTGGNIGLGYYTALNLARKGAEVTIVCRSKAKCDKAAKEMNDELPKPLVHTLIADHADLKTVAEACDAFAKTHDVLDIFVQNAGIPCIVEPERTKDGFFPTVQINHLAHFLMTEKLLPLIQKSKLARIVAVSSAANYNWPQDKPDHLRDAAVVNDDKQYPSFGVYDLSKLMNIMYARELNDRLGDKVVATSAHPGAVATNIWTKGNAQFKKIMSKQLYEHMFEPFMNHLQKNAAWTSEDGALTQVYCATKATKAEGGKYFHPVAQVVPPNPLAEDAELRKGLWTMSETLLRDKGFLTPSE